MRKASLLPVAGAVALLACGPQSMKPVKKGNCLIVRMAGSYDKIVADEIVRVSDRTLRIKRHGDNRFAEITFTVGYSINEEVCPLY